MIAEGFGSVLAELRQARRLSQARLAEMAGFDHSYVSRLETGSRNPGRDSVVSLAEAMALPTDERARLLRSAGFAGDERSDPAVEALSDLFGSNAVSAGVKERVRSDVLGYVRMVRAPARTVEAR